MEGQLKLKNAKVLLIGTGGLGAPLGLYLRHFAWSKDLSGVAQGPLPFFWGVNKIA